MATDSVGRLRQHSGDLQILIAWATGNAKAGTCGWIWCTEGSACDGRAGVSKGNKSMQWHGSVGVDTVGLCELQFSRPAATMAGSQVVSSRPQSALVWQGCATAARRPSTIFSNGC